ncbi:MAG: SDR family NAD(P)-dependent oxidoreductase [Oligoflexia bacterium]|nr:SDR family NAD(P)-dependent oxidoreductase [Oligoflexia bacterium]MBF0365962.1 SDR family NAD(P)-dependent oxidoreductase [Oligoflexia bacterium]
MKKIFITGASSGIGYELAKFYLSEGNIVGVCSRSLKKLTTAWEETYSILPSNLFLYEADVQNRERLHEAVSSFASEHGGLDIVVANAGTMITDKSSIPNFDNAREVINTNVIGVLNTFEIALKWMLDPKRQPCAGHLVAIASVAGFVGLPRTAPYSASKAAVLKLCESFAIDLKRMGITVTAIAPGFIDTPFLRYNKHPMPFMVPAPKAAKLIAMAIRKKKELYVFPLMMDLLMTTLYHLPRCIYRLLARNLISIIYNQKKSKKLSLLLMFLLVSWMNVSINVHAATEEGVKIVMTVDWEGMDLQEHNLQAMQAFRKKYPHIPMLHYLTPSYFTNPAVGNLELVRAKIKSVMLPIDEVGLHLHGWKSLFEAAGVVHRRSPNWLPGGRPLSDEECAVECGHNITITAYTREELIQVLEFSRSILKEQGLGHPLHFRAGGWMMSQALSEALAATRFVSDSSAVTTKYLDPDLEGYAVLDWLKALWGGTISATSQHYKVTNDFGSYYEVPDNLALADYISGEEMLEGIKKNMEEHKLVDASYAQTTTYIVLGFHQESAAEYLFEIEKMVLGVSKLQEEAVNGDNGDHRDSGNSCTLRFTTLPHAF